MLIKSSPSFISKVFEKTLEPFESGAIVHLNGDVLSLKYENLADIGTLGASAQTILKYFPLKKGDVILLNDPYSGGSVLSTMSLLTLLEKDLYLIVRTGFRPHLSFASKVDEEGLRVPPTPIATNYESNEAILQAMCEHPMAPENFKIRILDSLANILKTAKKFTLVFTQNSNLFTEAALKNYLAETRNRTLRLVEDEAFGEFFSEIGLIGGEILKLKLELSSEGLKLNFSGTSTSKRVCLTDSATFGACAGAFSAFFQKKIPINSGLFSLIQVESPLGSLLNAKFPSPTFLGMTEGVSIVAKTVLHGLLKLSNGKEVAEIATAPVMIQMQFSNGKKFFENIPGGTGASGSQDGADALHFWIRNHLETSVEEIERRFPILIKQFGLRQDSGGKGQFRGGHGMTREYEILEKTELSWMKESIKDRQHGNKGAKHGNSSEIYIVTGEMKKNLTESFGKIHLEVGDRLYVSTAGGCGFGRAKD